MDILSFFVCFETLTTITSCRRFGVIARAMLTMSGRLTMLSLSRWAGNGGSYRTIQRFFATKFVWSKMLVRFFQTHLFNAEHEYILAGDETVVSKSGNETFGIDRYFSGLKGKVIRGLSFFVFSLIDINERKSSPLVVKQIVRGEAEKRLIKERKKKRTKKEQGVKGRKKGSFNKNKNELKLSAELLRINELLKTLVKLLREFVKVKYLAMDGHFGHNQAVLMAKENDLDLISKLRKDAKLCEKYEGEYGGHGPKRKYGARLRYDLLPPKYLKKSEREKEIITNYYQGIFLHQEFGGELNVVIIVKIDLQRKKLGHAILFSSDTELGWEKLVDYYSLRFQIEFNFRDAKQHFGLEDFMTTTEIGVENAANMAFLMVNLSAKLLKTGGANRVGINDLKSWYRGVKYALETIKLVQPKAEAILIERVKEAISRIGSIHRQKYSLSSA